MLSFHYDVLSMNILTIGVTYTSVALEDGPHGCFASMSPEGKVTLIRRLLLSRVDRTRTSYGTSAREEYVCNQVSERTTCITRSVRGEPV